VGGQRAGTGAGSGKCPGGRVGPGPSYRPGKGGSVGVMDNLEDLLQTHPRAHPRLLPSVAKAAQALADCAAACTVCADACLAEDAVAHLRRCIRTDVDCAEICLAGSHLLLRQTETDPRLVREMLHACVMACQVCADECELHDHEHCVNCAALCRVAQEACNLLIGVISDAGVMPASDDSS
jgi:hypothetical protein